MIPVGDISAWIGAAIGASGLVTLATQPLRRIDRRLHALEDSQADIAAEMTPNHGSSMRDVVNETRSEVTTMRERFEDHLTYHRGQ